MFIGIQGYLKPEDNYDIILPPVSSWTLDKRVKGEKKNTYAGGFSTSTNKNNESRFYSITWDNLPESDYGDNGTPYVYSVISRIYTTTNVTTSPTTISILCKDKIPVNTQAWIQTSTGTLVNVTVTSEYTGNGLISIKSNSTTISVNQHCSLALHRARGVGLLTLAGYAATGTTHVLRDFMGNLVKVIFQSPKYNALTGTDEYNQLFYDVSLDIDLTQDTNSYAFKVTGGMQGNVSNESLPKVSSITTTSGAFDISSFYVESNGFNYINIDSLLSGTSYSLNTVFKLNAQSLSAEPPLRNLAYKLAFFKDYFVQDNQLNIKFVSKGSVIRQDNNPEIEITFDQDEYVHMGVWNSVTDYGPIVTWATGNQYPVGIYVTSNSDIYMSLESVNTKPLTDTTGWYKFPSNSPKIVSFEGKLYKLKVTSSKAKEPKSNASDWELIAYTPTQFNFKALPALTGKLTESNSLIFLLQPYTLIDTNNTPNQSATLLKIPIVKGSFIPNFTINSQSMYEKLSQINPGNSGELTINLLGNTFTLKSTSLSNLNNKQVGSNNVKLTPASLSVQSYEPRINIEQNPIISSYMAFYNSNTDYAISDGVVYLNGATNSSTTIQIRFAEGYVSKKAELLNSTPVVTSEIKLLKSFDTFSFDKKLLETTYDHSTKQIVQTCYQLKAVTPTVKLVLNQDNTINYKESGIQIELVKSTITGTATVTTDSTSLQTMSFSTTNNALYFANSFTYKGDKLDPRLVLSYFGL